MNELKTYECRIDDFFEGQPLISTHIALTPAKAKYDFWKDNQDMLKPFKNCLNAIKYRLIGKFKPSDIFGDIENFQRVCESRNLKFVYQGMIIDVSGKKGWITGGNCHNNFDVLFEGITFVVNCHPTTYYDKDMNIIKDFKKESVL